MSEAKTSRILKAALPIFLRYGFKRVNMQDLADAAGVSRPALYLLFKNKEEIFIGVFLQWVGETIADVESAIAEASTPETKLRRAFEIWALRPFEMALASPEAQELIECSFGFAQAAHKEGYARFEARITPVIGALIAQTHSQTPISPERIAHVLTSAVRGFKMTAISSAELQGLVEDLLILSFSSTGGETFQRDSARRKRAP